MRRVNPDIRHVLIGKAYAAELLRELRASAGMREAIDEAKRYAGDCEPVDGKHPFAEALGPSRT